MTEWRWTFIFILITSLPAIIVSWLVVVLFFLFRVVRDLAFEFPAILSAEWKPWVYKHWRYSNGIGRATIYQRTAIPEGTLKAKRVKTHEKIHIRQGEDEMMKAFLVGGIAGLCAWNFWLFLCIWCSGVLWLMVSYITSFLRHGSKHAYRQAEHERAAYCQSEINTNGHTWLEDYQDEF